jgi:hypothetical protein
MSLVRRAALAALLTLAAALSLSATASAVVQVTDDPDDPFESYEISSDIRRITFDSESSPGNLKLTVEWEFAASKRLGTHVFLDTDGDGRANWTVQIIDYADEQSLHPDGSGDGGVAKYVLAPANKSTTQCQSWEDADPPRNYHVFSQVPAHYRSADNRTVATITIPLSAIGNPASLVWGALATSGDDSFRHPVDLVPDGANNATDIFGQPVDPQNPPFAEYPWDCSPGNDASAGDKFPLDRGITLRLRDDAPPAPVRPYDPPATVSISSQTPEHASPGRPVTLTATASDPGGAILHTVWDLDGNGTYTDAPEQQTATTTFATAGLHRVGVRVIDSGGNASFAYRTIDVRDWPAQLVLTPTNATPKKSEKITIGATYEGPSSIDPSTIQWGFDADGAGDDDDPYTWNTGPSWTLGFGVPTRYVIKARATDADGNVVRGRTTIAVENQPPVPRGFLIRAKQVPDNPYNNDPLVKDKPIILEARFSDEQIPAVAWDLDGDGQYDDATGSKITQTYAEAGEKQVSARATDSGGLTATQDTSFEVRESEEAGCAGKATDPSGEFRAVGCFRPDPDNKAIKTTKDEVDLNGLKLIPQGGAQINIIPGLGKILTVGPGTVKVQAGDVVLFQGRFQADANCDSSKQECLLGQFSVPAFSKLKGFPLAGDVDVYLNPKGTRVHVNVDVLGSIGLGVTARADLHTEDGKGLILDGLEVRSPMIPIPGTDLTIGQFAVTYQGDTKRWTGSGAVTLPTPSFTKLSGDFAFSEITGFERAHGEVDGLDIPIDPYGVAFLQRIAFTIEIKGFQNGHPRVRLGGGLGISAGPRVAGVDIATVDGDFLVTFGDPFGIDVDGRISIAGYDVMGGTFSAYTNGDVAMSGFIGFGLPFPSALKGVRQDATKVKVSRISPNGADVYNPLFQIISVKGQASAWVEPQAFDMEASIYASVMGINLVGAQGLLSSTSIAGCGQILGIKGGFGYTYATDKTDLFGDSCDLGKYRPVRTFAPLDSNGAGLGPDKRALVARAAQAEGATAITVPADQKALFLKLDGAGGQPRVTLVSPSGKRYAMNADGTPVQGDDFFGARNWLADESYVGVRTPEAGQWIIEPQPGSVPIADVAGAPVLPEPEVSATVRPGGGPTRTLDYTVKPIDGQTVDFVEQGDDTHRTVGTADGASGSITFTPMDGNDQTRKLIAIVKQNGRDRAHIPVGTFVAPPMPKAPGPRRVRARRAAHGRAVVAWTPVPDAAMYTVVAHLGGGHTRYLQTRHTSVRVGHVGRRAARFDVRAIVPTASGKPRAGHAKLKAQRKHRHHRRHAA